MIFVVCNMNNMIALNELGYRVNNSEGYWVEAFLTGLRRRALYFYDPIKFNQSRQDGHLLSINHYLEAFFRMYEAVRACVEN